MKTAKEVKAVSRLAFALEQHLQLKTMDATEGVMKWTDTLGGD
jgi:hypothetical protein